MRRALVFLLLILLTGCASGASADGEGKTLVQNEDMRETETEPSMSVVETKEEDEEFLEGFAEAGAGAAMAGTDAGNEETTGDSVLPEDSLTDLSSEPSENDVSGDEAAAAGTGEDGSEEALADSGNTENNEAQALAGIFTSSELSDEIKARITGVSYPPGCGVSYDDLRYLQLSYVDFNGQTQLGEMICNKAVASDLVQIFSELFHAGYQIDKMRLIEEYGADDDLSCADDNTSCFNYRVVAGSTNLSKHALGVAVDLNPFYNPYVTYPNGKIRISPPGSEAYADRSADFPHKIDENDLAYKLFTQHGFTWGGHWKTLKDYQHFQKAL